MLRHVTTLLSLGTATMLAAPVAAQPAYPSGADGNIGTEIERWSKVIRESGVRAE